MSSVQCYIVLENGPRWFLIYKRSKWNVSDWAWQHGLGGSRDEDHVPLTIWRGFMTDPIRRYQRLQLIAVRILSLVSTVYPTSAATTSSKAEQSFFCHTRVHTAVLWQVSHSCVQCLAVHQQAAPSCGIPVRRSNVLMF